MKRKRMMMIFIKGRERKGRRDSYERKSEGRKNVKSNQILSEEKIQRKSRVRTEDNEDAEEIENNSELKFNRNVNYNGSNIPIPNNNDNNFNYYISIIDIFSKIP